jgi:hypothetical protein
MRVRLLVKLLEDFPPDAEVWLIEEEDGQPIRRSLPGDQRVPGPLEEPACLR